MADIDMADVRELLQAKDELILSLLADKRALVARLQQQQAPVAPSGDDALDIAAITTAAEERSRRDREDIARRKREMQASANGTAVAVEG